MKQKDIFLGGEGDKWFHRNYAALQKRDYGRQDRVVAAVAEIVPSAVPAGAGAPKLLEVGCGEAGRLAWLQSSLGIESHGVDPSQAAVDVAKARGLNVVRATADALPYPDNTFDIVVFGFCLYLCDLDDLFRIAAEADRVLKGDSWVVINDFFSSNLTTRQYRHRSGVFSRKMDYRRLFDWHPAYTCVSHDVRHHETGAYTDSADDWVAVSVMRKVAAD